MTKEEMIELATSLKRDGKCNCCQAVIYALKDYIDCDIEPLINAASGFAGGMGTGEATCGALIGANMVLGLIVKQGTIKYSNFLFRKFNEYTKDTICKVIKGIKTGVVLTDCPTCCGNAIRAFFDVKEMFNI